MAAAFALKAATVLGTAEGGGDGGKKAFTLYAVKVETQGNRSWSTAKRFTEFKELEAELELAGVVIEGVKLPKKKLMNTKGVVAKRQAALQLWLTHAISQHADHGILVQFLAQPAAAEDDGPAERKPPPEEFAELFALFALVSTAAEEGSEGEEAPTVRQLLARGGTAGKLDAAIGLLEAEGEAGGTLAVGFCAAGGAEEAAALLSKSAALLVAAAEPDSPAAAGAAGALQLLGLLALDSDWLSNNRFIYAGFGCTPGMAAGIAAALGACVACKRCCSLQRAAYRFISAASGFEPLAAAMAGAAPQFAILSQLLLELLERSEPLSWGAGRAAPKSAGAVAADGHGPAPYQAFRALPVARLAEETERGAEEAQKDLLKMASAKGIKSQEQYERDQEEARLASGIMLPAQRKDAVLADSVLALASLEGACDVTRRLLLQLLPPALCFGLRKIAEIAAASVRVPDAAAVTADASPDTVVLEMVAAFALETTRTSRLVWGEQYRTELRARCEEQKRRADLAVADTQGSVAAAAESARWDALQPVYRASADELVVLGYHVGVLLDEAAEQGYVEMKERAEAGAAGEERLLKAAMECAASCILDTPEVVGEGMSESVAGEALIEELELPTTVLDATDVGSNLGHLSTLLRMLLLLVVVSQPSKKAGAKINKMMQHGGLLSQLSAVAGGSGQCGEPLQMQALELLQLAAVKPVKKGEKAPLVMAMLTSVELLEPLLQGLKQRPVRPTAQLALLHLVASLTDASPKILSELLKQRGIVTLLGISCSADATEEMHDQVSELLRLMSKSPLHGHHIEDTLSLFLPEAVVSALLADPEPGATERFKFAEQTRSPALIWTATMNARFRQAVDAALTVAAGERADEAGTKVAYEELGKEQYLLRKISTNRI